MGWYIVITEEMRDLGLNGNDLLVFACIYGYSQEGEGCYYGSLPTLAKRCGIARRTVVDILKRLTDGGFLTKRDIYRNGVKFCAYEASAKSARVVQNLHGGSAEIAPNNKEENKDRFIDKPSLSNAHAKESKKSSFVPPTIDEVREYCAARFSKVDPEAFVAFYQSKGWKIGSAPMKDWRAAVITWEKREAQQPRPSTPSPSSLPRRKESYVETAYRTYDKIFGTDLHKQKYGND